MTDAKDDVLGYLRQVRGALVFKFEGLGEYDLRRPLTPTGTNLLGLVKHLASVEAGYLGSCFGRPFPEPMPWLDEGAADNADMWVTPAEPTADMLALFDRVAAHSEATITALDLQDRGTVPWWPEDRRNPTLHRVLIHYLAEINRHTGQADILREQMDGAIGHRADNSNLPELDQQQWVAYRDTVERAAREAAGQTPESADPGAPNTLGSAAASVRPDR